MIDRRMHVWDCAALLPVIEEAGGRSTDRRGERTIRGGDAVASNGLLHDQGAGAPEELARPAGRLGEPVPAVHVIYQHVGDHASVGKGVCHAVYRR